MQKMHPKPAMNWAHNFHAGVNSDMCTGYGACTDRCQIEAVTVDERNGYATIDLDRCIGCGNCVTVCPSDAMRLVKIETETIPPENRTSLYRILAEKK